MMLYIQLKCGISFIRQTVLMFHNEAISSNELRVIALYTPKTNF